VDTVPLRRAQPVAVTAVVWPLPNTARSAPRPCKASEYNAAKFYYSISPPSDDDYDNDDDVGDEMMRAHRWIPADAKPTGPNADAIPVDREDEDIFAMDD
jgi:hypothetical protein